MLSTGEIIKVTLDRKGLSIKDLIELTGLREAAILNVIYNRTNKAEYLQRISSALDIPLDSLLKTNKNYEVDVNIYKKSIDIVFAKLENLNIRKISSKIIHDYVNAAYRHLLQSNDDKATALYIEGMLEGHAQFATFK